MRQFLFATIIFICTVSSATAATYVVTKTADTNDGVCDSDCSFREAVGAANATPDNDVVTFSLALFTTPQTITLSGSEILIANAGTFTMDGPGANWLTFDGNNASRILATSAGAAATINNARFTRGTGVGSVTGRGGAIYNNAATLTLNNLVITGNSAANGGGVNNAGTATLTINNTVISNNTVTGAGGGAQNFSGNTMIINNSSIFGNTSASTTSGGGAIQANGTVRITNSTIARNNGGGGSGAIYFNGIALTLTNVTMTANTSTLGGGGVHKTTANPAVVRNSIIAGNNGSAVTPDIAGDFASEGNNIIGAVATSTGWVASDLQNTNPLLSPAGFYGGTGLTAVPLGGSPAINGGQNCVTNLSCSANNPPVAVTTDQRGAGRPANTTVDIGAVEVDPSYVATLPGATFGQPYNFTLADGFTGFTYLLSSGTFGGVTLTSAATSATLGGTPNVSGIQNGGVQVTNGPNSTTVNYALPIAGPGGTGNVRGRILDSAGAPVANANVWVRSAGGSVVGGRTNFFGFYSIDGVAIGGLYDVSASFKGLTFPTVRVQLFAASAEASFSATSAQQLTNRGVTRSEDSKF